MSPVSSSGESSNVLGPWDVWKRLISRFLFIFVFQQSVINLGVFFFEFILLGLAEFLVSVNQVSQKELMLCLESANSQDFSHTNYFQNRSLLSRTYS